MLVEPVKIAALGQKKKRRKISQLKTLMHYKIYFNTKIYNPTYRKIDLVDKELTTIKLTKKTHKKIKYLTIEIKIKPLILNKYKKKNN